MAGDRGHVRGCMSNLKGGNGRGRGHGAQREEPFAESLKLCVLCFETNFSARVCPSGVLGVTHCCRYRKLGKVGLKSGCCWMDEGWRR